MTRRAVVLCLSLFSFFPASCLSSTHQSQTSPTPSVETQVQLKAEVEKAYLNAWTIYSHALETWDTSQLASAFGSPALEQVQREVAKLREANHQIVVQVQHDYRIGNLTNVSALVLDTYINSSVLIDARTKQPISSPGASSRATQTFTLERSNKVWKVIKGFTSGQ